MRPIHIFISSVQLEFTFERQILYDYLHEDPLLGRFFVPFIFEKLPASDSSAQKVYLEQVEKCDIYLGIFGEKYGWEDSEGISPTEREYDHATKYHKTKLIFLTNHTAATRHPKEVLLIKKAEQTVVRKQFGSVEELKSAVYAALVKYLEEKEYIRTIPFDATWHKNANIDDLDEEKIRTFVRTASRKRSFPLSSDASLEDILTHLNLYEDNKINNASILLFGKAPQKYFISSEIKCAQFHGTEIAKPIPAYHIYKGDVFQLVNQAVDFVLSRIDLAVGTRHAANEAPTQYELPREAVTEAIVNAVAHRDYASNGSVQVMLFRDRLEIWNPGRLPFELTPEKLYKPHHSIPTNPILANPMYLAGYIEQMGTGTGDILKLCAKYGLKKPEFVQEEIFRVILWRKETVSEQTGSKINRKISNETSHKVSDEVFRLIMVLSGEEKRAEIRESLGLASDDYFRENYLKPALSDGYAEMTFPENPNHPQQQYRLTAKGLELKKSITTEQHTEQVRMEIVRLVAVMPDDKEERRSQIQNKLGLKHRMNFIESYLIPALSEAYISMKFPEIPNHPQQYYRLTDKGKALKKGFNDSELARYVGGEVGGEPPITRNQLNINNLTSEKDDFSPELARWVGGEPPSQFNSLIINELNKKNDVFKPELARYVGGEVGGEPHEKDNILNKSNLASKNDDISGELAWSANHTTEQPPYTYNSDNENSAINEPTAEYLTKKSIENISDTMQSVVLSMNDHTQFSLKELQNSIGLKNRQHFNEKYLAPTLKSGLIEMLFPETPNHPKQRYKLTEKGMRLRNTIK